MRASWRGVLAALVGGVVLLSPAGAAASPVFPPATNFLVDTANVIPAADEQRIIASLAEYSRRTEGEVAVAVVPTVGDTSIEDYATDLFGRWGVGSKERDLGVLLVVAVQERQMRIETGYGAEAYVTDIQSRQILDEMRPLLQAGNYAGAVDLGQQRIRRTLGDDTAAAAPQRRAPQAQRRSSGSGSLIFFLLPLLFIFMGGIGGIGGSRRRRRRRGLGYGVPIIYGGSWGGGGWGGGGYGGGGFGGGGGGFGGGGGGGFGGFGGGDSGGGGASGSW